MKLTKSLNKVILGATLALLLAIPLMTGCKTAKLEPGGAYAPGTNVISLDTNGVAVTNFVPSAQADLGFLLADEAYKLAYLTVDGALKLEMNNRAAVAKISPAIKPALDKVRVVMWSTNAPLGIEQRWATARKAYKANPTPAGLSSIQLILAEAQKLVPIVQEAIQPVYTLTAVNAVQQ